MWPTLVAVSFTVAHGGLSPEPSCVDDVVLLQQSHHLATKSKTHASTPPYFYGPDDAGLCNWASVFGAEVPAEVADVRILFDSKCNEDYSEELCTSLTAELFSTVGEAGSFSSEVEGPLLFCTAMTDLILTSLARQEESGQHASLLKRAKSGQGEGTLEMSVSRKANVYGPSSSQIRKESLLYGPDGEGLCNWASVFGVEVPTAVADVRLLFHGECEALYSGQLCTSVTDELFSTLDEADSFSSEMEGHPQLCVEMNDLILTSYAHQAGKGNHAALLNRANSGQAEGTLEQSVSGKYMSGPPTPSPYMGPHPWQKHMEHIVDDLAHP